MQLLIYANIWERRKKRNWTMRNILLQIVSLDEDTSEFSAKSTFDHPYPTTKIMWIPDTKGVYPDLLATSGGKNSQTSWTYSATARQTYFSKFLMPGLPEKLRPPFYIYVRQFFLLRFAKGAFTQSVLRGVIRRRLGYLKNKKCFFTNKTTILRGVFCPSVNAT